jgi:hypothetical protein
MSGDNLYSRIRFKLANFRNYFSKFLQKVAVILFREIS